MLHPYHIRLLKAISKNKVIRISKPNKDLDHLLVNGYIEMTVCDNPNDYFAQPYLTEKGKARLYEEKRKFIDLWLPVTISSVLSIAALVISIIALLK
ncbi:MAG: hypothetical protein IKB51_07285 [Clostridia bacterium]|nr:hypothetical protein [Clostridia bacterium]